MQEVHPQDQVLHTLVGGDLFPPGQ